MQEGKHSTSAHFLTLTYNTDSVPITKKGFMTLDKTEPQRYFKRLRKLNPDSKIKYYVCGEYGGKTSRPHYHAIIFNANIETLEQAWALNNQSMGDIYIGDVNGASIGYVLKYMCKEPDNPIPRHQNDDRIPVFSHMSKGLGKSYLTDNMKSWHLNDLENRMYVPLEQGQIIPMPRYYKQKIYTDEQRQTIGRHFKQILYDEDKKLQNELGEAYEQTRLTKGLDSIRKSTRGKQRLNEVL
ncbi:MAG: replication initiator protein [Microvirus sp.]|nr:MAG: replication initiator protein [Microvirus sp.]